MLTRELIETGGIGAMVARDAPTMRILSDQEREASLHATLAARPDGDVWLFGYGSLIWNPTVHAIERRTARIDGWHRAFCLSSRVGRGSLDNPGLGAGTGRGRRVHRRRLPDRGAHRRERTGAAVASRNAFGRLCAEVARCAGRAWRAVRQRYCLHDQSGR